MLKSLVSALLLIIGLSMAGYSVWTETGVYEWWAGLLLNSRQAYSVTYATLLTWLTLVIPCGLLSFVGYGVHADSHGNKLVGGLGLILGGGVLLGGFLFYSLAPPTAPRGTFKQLFASGEVVPQDLVIDPRSLPALDFRHAVGVSMTGSSGSVKSTMLYVPFAFDCWPDPSTPVIFAGQLTSPALQRSEQPSRARFNFAKRPIPWLIRREWKTTTEAAIMVDDGRAAGKFFESIGLPAVILLLASIRILWSAYRDP